MRERNHYGRLLLYFSVLVAWSWLIPQPALAANAVVGKTLTLTGSVSIQREGRTWQLQVGEYIHLHDRLQTGIVSRVEILFMDQSRIRMAPNTTLEITEYLYQPEKKKRKGLLSLWAGKARFIVNDLVDFTQKDFEVRTQAGIAGTRGTDFIMKLGPLAQLEPPPELTPQEALEAESDVELTVIEGEVYACPKDEEGNIIEELCVLVRGGEYVIFGVDRMGEPTEAPEDQMDDAIDDVDEPDLPPEAVPPGDLPTPELPPPELPPADEPFETPTPQPESQAETG
jgi:hypothetical protein